MTTSETALTLDLRAVHRNLYTAPGKAPQIVEVPELLALAASGSGNPASEAWIGAVQSLFTLAYGLRKQMKTLDPPVDARVMPLEGIWSRPDDRAFANIQPGELRWTLLIVVPDSISWNDLNARGCYALQSTPRTGRTCFHTSIVKATR
jgi:hypothetical protein